MLTLRAVFLHTRILELEIAEFHEALLSRICDALLLQYKSSLGQRHLLLEKKT